MAVRVTSTSCVSTSMLLAWINRALEFLWLAAVVLVPLAFLDREYVVSEAVIAYVEVPKVAILRTVAGLVAVLWLIEWATRGTLIPGQTFAWHLPRIRASSLWSGLANWLRGRPDRWLLLAVWLFLASTLLTTALSGSFQTSLWGEIPGQDGYAAYTVVSYVLLYAVIATHLKTRSQVGRLVAAMVGVGVLVGGYAVLQHYGQDFLNLTEQTGGGQERATSFMGNAIFSAAVMSMTIPITLMAGAVAFKERYAGGGKPGRSLNQWLLGAGITFSLGAALAIQLLGIAFTLSRGPWMGTILSLAAFLILTFLFVGWRHFSRAALFLGLAAILASAVLQWQGSVSILGTGPWSTAVIVLIGIAATIVIHANWRRIVPLALLLGAGLIVLAAVILGPSGFRPVGGFLGDQPGTSDSAVSGTAAQLGGRFSSVGSEVLSGFSGGRGIHWKVSWLLIRDRPWFAFDELSLRWLRPLIGYGPDLFRYTYLLESHAEGRQFRPLEPDHAHNYFIHQTVEQGLLGLFSSTGIFLTAFLAGGYLLLRQRRGNCSTQKLLIIGLLAILAGRAMEMTVGVARVSDLTVLWVVLGLLTSLLAVTHPPHLGQSEPQRSVARQNTTRSRPPRGRASSLSNLRMQPRLLWRLAIVTWLVGGIGVLTWVKSVNYVRAAVVEGQAMQHFRQGDFQAALTSLDRAIDLAPDVPTYHTNRASLYLAYLVNKGAAPERGCSLPNAPPYEVCLATQIYRSNLNGTKTRPFYYRSRAALAHSANLFPQSDTVQRYTESLSLLPNSWHFRNYLGEAYTRAGQPEAALQPLIDSLRIAEDRHQSAEALYLLGLAYGDLGRTEEEVQSFERSLEFGLSGDQAVQAHQTLGRFYIDSGEFERAIEGLDRAIRDLDQAVTLAPLNADSHFNRGQAYSGLGDYPQALKDFDQAIHISRGHLYLKDPIFFSYFFSRALARFNLDDYRGAIEDLDEAIEKFPHPDIAEAHVLRGISYGRLGRAEMAAEVLREYVTAIDDLDLGYRHNLQVASVFYTRGLAHFYLGNFLQAIVYFDEAIKLTPQLAEALAMRGRALLALGREGEAARDLERAERLNSG